MKIPANEKLHQDRGPQQHMLGALMRVVSTREYDAVLPKMAETVGVSRSSVSRQSDRGQRRAIETVARETLGHNRHPGDLH